VASVDRVNPIATAAKVQIASPYQAIAARDGRKRRGDDEDREPHDTVELHEEEALETDNSAADESGRFDGHGIDFST